MTLPHATTPLPSVAGAPSIRQTEKRPHPEGHALPVRLALQGTAPAGLRYALTCYWEARHAGRVQRTTLEKELTLHYLPVSAERARLTYLEAPPVLRKPDLSAFEKAVLLLASLYQHLELDVSPTGQLLALHNHAAILETWDAVEQELVRRSAGEDDVTQDLRTAMGTLLQDPANLLASLGYDYAFGWLLPDFYGQRFESGWRYVRPRSFDRFFAGADLCFMERLELGSAPADGQATLHLRGTLDPIRTDLAAVAQQVDAEREAARAADPAPATEPAAISGTYDATYQLDRDTGWPVTLDVSVRCRAGAEYSKEYFFRLEQLPAS
ncbi:MAG TPA: hypothetical protein VF630_01860 [Hymenobacter sp.]